METTLSLMGSNPAPAGFQLPPNIHQFVTPIRAYRNGIRYSVLATDNQGRALARSSITMKAAWYSRRDFDGLMNVELYAPTAPNTQYQVI